MADDVASFFKTKKSKKHSGHGVHANVQTPDVLARRLERTVQQQQMLDRENGIEENEDDLDQQRPSYTQQFSGGSGGAGVGTGTGGGGEVNKENSEWLDYQEQQDIDLAKIGIKEMEIREETDQEVNEDEESVTSRKTWNIPGQQQPPVSQKAKKPNYAAGMDVDEGEEGAGVDEKAASATKPEEQEQKVEDQDTEESKAEGEKEEGETKSKYVPPSMRNKQLAAASRPTSSMKKPNITDAMEFPSLAAAGEFEAAAEIEKTKKKKPQPPMPKKTAWGARVQTTSPAQVGETQTSGPPRQHPEPVASAPEPVQPAGDPQKPVYLPPHLRKRGGAS